ncbi:lysophospholipid acyltransferase family protein [Streptomyces solincola]|uniref:lysophospholipid acyltransferase family protein n=1 Tax=Streptomyces solincola TaxID=2100817 RepID=UPI002159A353|nr:lysophospholipid acyltransferase family protein [Streptomyces solincola]
MDIWLPRSPCTPAACAHRPDRRASPAGTLARLTGGLLAVLLGVLLAPLAAPLGRPARAALMTLWCRTVLAAFGVRVRVHGAAPPGGPLLIAANHVSWLDIPLIAGVLPGRMLAKSDLRRWPVLGPLAALAGTLFVERDRLRALPGAVRAMTAALAGGSRVTVFPEGSTWCGRAQGRFRPAPFQAAVDAGAPVQPVRLAYRPTGPAAFVGEDTLAASLWRVAAAGGLTADVTLLPVIPAGHPGAADRRALARAAQDAVRPPAGCQWGVPESDHVADHGGDGERRAARAAVRGGTDRAGPAYRR